MDIIDELAWRARAMRQARYYGNAECLERAAAEIRSLRAGTATSSRPAAQAPSWWRRLLPAALLGQGGRA